MPSLPFRLAVLRSSVVLLAACGRLVAARPRETRPGRRSRVRLSAHAPRPRSPPTRRARSAPQRPGSGSSGIEPLGILDQAQQRPVLGRGGQQAEHGQSHEEPLRRLAGRHSQRDAQGIALRCGDRVKEIEHRRAQLMDTREWQLPLGLDGGYLGNAKPGGLAGRLPSSARALAPAGPAPGRLGETRSWRTRDAWRVRMAASRARTPPGAPEGAPARVRARQSLLRVDGRARRRRSQALPAQLLAAAAELALPAQPSASAERAFPAQRASGSANPGTCSPTRWAWRCPSRLRRPPTR